MPIWTGYNPPFLGPDGVLPVQQDVRLIKNDYIQLLLTNYGERVMKPDYGSPIPGLQFENLIDQDISRIRSEVFSITSEFEPRITLQDVIVKMKPDNATVIINIYGTVNLNPNERFVIEINVSNGGVTLVRVE